MAPQMADGALANIDCTIDPMDQMALKPPLVHGVNSTTRQDDKSIAAASRTPQKMVTGSVKLKLAQFSINGS